jgi:hypothetical protein
MKRFIAFINLFILSAFAQTSPSNPDVYQNISVGATATITCLIDPSNTPLTFKWYRDGVLVYTDVTGGRLESTLVVSNFQTTNVGRYYVVVSNILGTTTSNNIYLSLDSGFPPSQVKIKIIRN